MAHLSRTVARIPRARPLAAALQDDPFRGLDTLDEFENAATTTDNTYRYWYSGSGVTAWVLDTGILTTHIVSGCRAVPRWPRRGLDLPVLVQEFDNNRATDVTSFVTSDSTTTDCNGHGTHVAGILGGKTAGVAKQVTLKSIRILDCTGSGTTTGEYQGMDYVLQNGAPPAVVSMSLGGPDVRARRRPPLRSALSPISPTFFLAAAAHRGGLYPGTCQEELHGGCCGRER